LYLAAVSGTHETVEWVLVHGADVNAPFDLNPKCFANVLLTTFHFERLKELKCKTIDTIETRIEYDADIQKNEPEALHLAKVSGYPEDVRKLLRRKPSQKLASKLMRASHTMHRKTRDNVLYEKCGIFLI
jgi:hypothetical protein